MMEKGFCIGCGEYMVYRVEEERTEFVVRGRKMRYTEKVAYCTNCGEPMYVPWINDENCLARERAYKKATNGKENY